MAVFLMKVFLITGLSKQLDNGALNIPGARALPERIKRILVFIVADDAFAMKPYIMKPYAFRHMHGSQRIYNYRLSRARRIIIDNVFGLVSARFRLLRTRILSWSQTKYQLLCRPYVFLNFLSEQNK
jgi:hypothetical protein